MPSLKQTMADNGFESNENYNYVLTALAHSDAGSIPCLNIEGDGGRRKTAFANALAHAQEHVDYIFYHDFSVEETAPPPPSLHSEDEPGGKHVPPVSALDKVLSDACAYSEADTTILILDQLQAADFKDQIRLYRFLVSREWHFPGSSYEANPRKLTVYIISEEPVYHSLQKHSYKVWVDSVSDKQVPYTPADFKLADDIAPVMAGLAALFDRLAVTPTFSEYKKILEAIPHYVHTAEHLSNTVYGWTEGIDRQLLNSSAITDLIQEDIMPAIERYLGVEDVVELTAPPYPADQPKQDSIP